MTVEVVKVMMGDSGSSKGYDRGDGGTSGGCDG